MAARTDVERASTRPDPQLDWRWIVIDPIPFGQNFKMDCTYIESVDLPIPNVAAEQIRVSGRPMMLPGLSSLEAFTINFYNDVDGRAFQYLLYWKGLVKDFGTGIYGYPSDYMADLQVALLDNKGEEVVRACLMGIWPADTNNLSLSYDGNSRLALSQNFAIQNIDFTFKKFKV